MDIKFDKYSLTRNGNREIVWAGAIHYFRLPSRAEWKKRIRMMKDAGLNAVDVYFAWNYHTEEPGRYDFQGIRDIEYFMDEIEKQGLWIIARPGPYICAEVDGGGIPGWVLADKNIILRCRREGRLEYCEEYMKYVREWWEQIVPRIAKRKNLLIFQIENEFNLNEILHTKPAKELLSLIRRYKPDLLMKAFASDLLKTLMFEISPRLLPRTDKEEENRYMRTLYDWSRELGIEKPIFHNDTMSMSGRAKEVDIMAIDDYAITEFSSDWRDREKVFAALDIVEEGLERHGGNMPVFLAEFQGSWYDNWGGFGYDRIRNVLGTDQLDLATKSALAQRATIINYFMFSGGTTWGYMTSPDVYTSYDMASPISESGLKTERYDVIEWIIRETGKRKEDFLETEVDESVKCTPGSVFCKARKTSTGRKLIFLRNMGKKPVKCKLNCLPGAVRLEKTEMKILIVEGKRNVIREIGPYKSEKTIEKPERKNPALPELNNWHLSWGSPQIGAGFDDSDWKLLEDEPAWDFDSLGTHYGYGWYRGTYRGRLEKMRIDARHCLSIFLNGKLIASKDNFRNTTGVGDDVAEEFDITIPGTIQQGGMNVITALVESLGHNKDFEEDARNPRGIVSIKTKGSKVVWRFRGGLLKGEKGLCPVLSPECFSDYKPKAKVQLPHFWEPYEEGIGLYETTVEVKVKNPGDHPVGLVIPEALSKANIYVNGYLMGRYWHEKGPQRKFYIPWGILKSSGKNHIAIAVWKRWETGCLGKVRLECY